MFVIKTTNSEKIASSLVEILINRVKFIYSEKATNFCEIFPLLLTTYIQSKEGEYFAEFFDLLIINEL